MMQFRQTFGFTQTASYILLLLAASVSLKGQNATSVLGADLIRSASGDPELKFTGPADDSSADLITVAFQMYEGQPAFFIPVSHRWGGWASKFTSGYLVIARNRVAYEVTGGSARLEDSIDRADRIEIRQAGHWQDKARSSWYEINVQLRTPTRKLELTPLARNPAGGQVGYADDKHHGLDNLLAELMKNFDGALSSFERAAGITDPDRQLSVEAHFHRLSSSELTARIAEEDRLAKENERIEKEKEKAQKKGGGGWGLLGAIALGAAEGVSGGGADSPILQAGAAQAAAIRAIGNRNAGAQSVPAGNSASSAAAGQSIQMQTQQDSPSSAVVKVPPAYAPAPINIHFQNTPNFTLGHAHVTSTPSGIDCPGVCSYSFGRGGNVSLQAVADQNSIVRSMSCDMSGSSAPFRPGNSDTCAYPFADGGGTVVVYVDAVNSAPQSGGNTSITSNGSGKQGTAGHPGVGLTSRGPMAAPNETQSCTDMSKFVTATVKTGSDDIVYGYVTNHSDQTLSISVTFATGGKPNKDQAAMVTVGPGKTLGGSGGGIWATTSAVDHNPPEIFWYAVPQSEVNRLCVEPF